MSPAKWFPYGLAVVWLICAGILAMAVSQGATGMVQAFYVATIVLSIIALLASLVSSVAVAAARFNRYWSSGFPVLLALGLLGYGLFKAAFTPTMIAVLVVCVSLGYVLGMRLSGKNLRFLPVLMVSTLLIGGELTIVPPEVKASVFVLCSGLMAAALWNRKNQKP